MRLALLAPLLIAIPLSFGSVACNANIGGGPKSLTYTDDAKKAYDEALHSFREKDYESARALFEEVKKTFPGTIYQRLAELRLADCDFAQDKYSEAISGYRGYVTTYRTDREVEYARYRLAKALYFDIDDTVLLPPAEERDQATTADSYRELRSFLRVYPRSRYKQDIDFMLEVVTGRLVRHELYMAHYYRGKDNYEAAIGRINYAMKTFPNSGLDAEALILKGETFMMMNHRAEARAAFEKELKDWGGPFGQRARNYIAELDKPTQPPPIIQRPPDPGLPPLTDKEKNAAAAPAPQPDLGPSRRTTPSNPAPEPSKHKRKRQQ